MREHIFSNWFLSFVSEKLDDVVFNVLKFKEALKRQLLLEEEEDEEEMEVDLATATATTSLYKSKSWYRESLLRLRMRILIGFYCANVAWREAECEEGNPCFG